MPEAVAIYEAVIADPAAGPAAVEARLRLSYILAEGLGVPADKARASRLLEEAAVSGNSGALTALGNARFWGQGAAKDEAGGLALLEQAARAGHVEASISLAQIYRWVRRDPVASLPHARAAADAGDEPSMALLAAMYRDGIGAAADLDAAILWFQRGAVSDGSGQRASLTEIYVNRRPDPVKAAAWALLAGDNISPEGRGVALGRADPAQRAEAEALATRCRDSGFLRCD